MSTASPTHSNELKEYHKALRRKLRRLKVPNSAVKELGVELGHGAFAKVRLLEVFGMRCAGKQLHGVLFKDASKEIAETLVDRFAEECIRLGELRHPNIVQLVGVTFDEKSLTLIMEYLPLSLTDFLEGYENIPDFIKGSVLLDAAYGLLFLHQQEPPIVHRDLSTNNILLTRELQAKIGDLGVARRLIHGEAGLQELMSLCPGTQNYMPPEAKTASELDPNKAEYDVKMDCFSFGNIIIQVILQTWLDYLLDADPENPNQPMKDEVKRRSYYLSKMSDHMLYDLTIKCLDEDPTARPTSAEILKKVKAYRDDNPPPFQNIVEMWHAFVDSSNQLRELQKENARMKVAMVGAGDELTKNTSYERLKLQVRQLEEKVLDKDEELSKKEREIAGHKSSIVSLKTMLGAATAPQEQANGDIPISTKMQPELPSPIPPSRDKKKQPPPKPPRPWTFSMTSSPPLSPPPSSPESSPLLAPKPRTSVGSSEGSTSSLATQQNNRDFFYSELPAFPDLNDEKEPRPLIRSKPLSMDDDTIEISGMTRIQPMPRKRASTHTSNFLPKPRTRNQASSQRSDGSPTVAAPLPPPQKPPRTSKPTSTPNDGYEELQARPRKSSTPESAGLMKLRKKPLPPIPQSRSPINCPDSPEDSAGIYEVPITLFSNRDKKEKSSEHYEVIPLANSSIYEVMEPAPNARTPRKIKPVRPAPPPKPSPQGEHVLPRKRSNPGIPKVAMLPLHSGSQDTQFQKLLARQQMKLQERDAGGAGGAIDELEKPKAQPPSDNTDVDPTLKRKLAKRKDKLKAKFSFD